MARYLITGGAGFIGSHLCESFLNQGHEVLCMDNYSTGAKHNIAPFLKNPRFRFIDHNVSRYIEVPEPLDYVLHFASPASPVDYLELPIPTLKVGALGTHNTLGLAKSKNAVYLLASTSEVYGDPLVRPQNEEYWGNVNPIGPRGVYDEAKRFAEAMTMAYHRYHGLNTRIVRDLQHLRAAHASARWPSGAQLHHAGAERRAADGLWRGPADAEFPICRRSDRRIKFSLLKADHHLPVNIGNPHEMTVLEFAKKIIELTGSKSTIAYKPLPEDDPQVRQPDITKAKTILGWEPKVMLEEGLLKTIDYFRSQLKERAG